MDFEELEDLIAEMIDEQKGNGGKLSFGNVVEHDRALKREIYLGSIVDGVGSTVDSYIRYWNSYDEEKRIPVEERKPIKIYIDSPGGLLTDTFTMIDSISLSKTPVWTVCTGCAYSGGFFTFIAGHKKIAYPTASFLFHEGATSNGGDAGKFRNFAAFYEKEMKQLKDIVIKYTSIEEEEYDKHIKDDWWFTSEEALSHGICDEIAKEFV